MPRSFNEILGNTTVPTATSVDRKSFNQILNPLSDYEYHPDRGLLDEALGMAASGGLGVVEMTLKGLHTLGVMDARDELDSIKHFRSRSSFDDLSRQSMESKFRRQAMEAIQSATTSIGAGLAGAPFGVAGMAIAGAPLYGAAAYYDFMEEARQAGIPEDQIRDKAIIAGLAEGGLELGMGLALGKLIGFTPAGQMTRTNIRAALKTPAKQLFLKKWLPTYLEIAASEIPTEMAQEAAGVYLREKAEILTSMSPLEAAREVVVPTALSSIIFATIGAGGNSMKAAQMQKQLKAKNLLDKIPPMNSKEPIDEAVLDEVADVLNIERDILEKSFTLQKSPGGLDKIRDNIRQEVEYAKRIGTEAEEGGTAQGFERGEGGRLRVRDNAEDRLEADTRTEIEREAEDVERFNREGEVATEDELALLEKYGLKYEGNSIGGVWFTDPKVNNSTGMIDSGFDEDQLVEHLSRWYEEWGEAPVTKKAGKPIVEFSVKAVEQPEPAVVGPVWYSKLKKTVETLMPVKMAANSVRNWLKSAQVKDDELKWTGVDEWLEKQEGTVTKGDLLKALQEVNVGETTLTERETKFSQYQLPGEKQNYRELLLTLPGRRGWLGENSQGEGKVFSSKEEATSFAGVNGEVTPWSSEQGFKSSHYDQPNILAHVRLNERIDANGNKVLFIEEIQSDWHQRGREQGYGFSTQEQTRLDELQKQWESGVFDVGDPRLLELTHLKSKRARGGDVPPAPFSKTWHEMAMRRMLRWAAENGFDKLAWTTGEQQAERYDLSKHVKEIEVTDVEDGRGYTIDATLPDDSTRRIVENIPAEKLHEYVGKDLAKKIIENPNQGTFSGLDLKVGGEGMKGFYDKMIVDYANKFGKKWGARVEDTAMIGIGGRVYDVDDFFVKNGKYYAKTENETVGPFDTLDEAMTETRDKVQAGVVHSLPITASMRESVMQGQPMFKVTPEAVSTRKSNETTLARMLEGSVGGLKIEIVTDPAKWKEILKRTGGEDKVRESEGKKVRIVTDAVYDPKTKTAYIHTADTNTLIHESAHPVLKLMAKQNPGTYGKMVKLVRQSPYMKTVTDLEYTKRPDEEALARAIADQGEQLWDAKQKSQFQAWLAEMWDSIKTTVKQVFGRELTLEEYSKVVARKLLTEGSFTLDGAVEQAGVQQAKSKLPATGMPPTGIPPTPPPIAEGPPIGEEPKKPKPPTPEALDKQDTENEKTLRHKNLQKSLHVWKTAAGWTDAEYRDKLKTITGKESTEDMTADEISKVMYETAEEVVAVKVAQAKATGPIVGADEHKNKGQQILDKLSKYLYPASIVRRMFGADITAEIIKAGQAGDSAQAKMADKKLGAIDMAVKEFRDYLNELPEAVKQEFNIYHLVEDTHTPEGTMRRKQAMEFLQAKYPHLLDKKYTQSIQQLYDMVFERAKVAKGNIGRAGKLFYGQYTIDTKFRDAMAKNLNIDAAQYWLLSDKFSKEASYRSYADAVVNKLVLRRTNIVDNLLAELRSVEQLISETDLRENLLRLTAERVTGLEGGKPGRPDFIVQTGVWVIKDGRNKHLFETSADAEEFIKEQRTKNPDDKYAIGDKISAPEGFVKIGAKGDPVWGNNIYAQSDIAHLINNGLAINLISKHKPLRKLRDWGNNMRLVKFMFSGFHMMTITKQLLADSHTILGLDNMARNVNLIFNGRKVRERILEDPILRVRYERLLDLGHTPIGGMSRFAFELEALNSFRETWDSSGAAVQFRKAPKELRKLVALPTRGFTDWLFRYYIPTVATAKVLQEEEIMKQKLGKDSLSDAELMDIIKQTQYLYGEVNESLYGRSGTVTSLLRFFFFAPGFAEGNYATNLVAMGKGIGGHRARMTIMNSLLGSAVMATIGTVMLTGKPPKLPKDEDDIRDMFKIDTGKKDYRGREIMIDTLTFDKDYWDVYGEIGKTIIGRDAKEIFSLLYNIPKTVISRLGGMKSNYVTFAKDLIALSEGRAMVDWKGDEVYHMTDPLMTKIWKGFTHTLDEIAPISFSVYKQTRQRRIGRGIATLESLMGFRPVMSEKDKKEATDFRALYDLKEKRDAQYRELSRNNNPRKMIASFNRNIDRFMRNEEISNNVKREIEKLYIDPDQYIGYSINKLYSPNTNKAQRERIYEILYNFDIKPAEYNTYVKYWKKKLKDKRRRK